MKELIEKLEDQAVSINNLMAIVAQHNNDFRKINRILGSKKKDFDKITHIEKILNPKP